MNYASCGQALAKTRRLVLAASGVLTLALVSAAFTPYAVKSVEEAHKEREVSDLMLRALPTENAQPRLMSTLTIRPRIKPWSQPGLARTLGLRPAVRPGMLRVYTPEAQAERFMEELRQPISTVKAELVYASYGLGKSINARDLLTARDALRTPAEIIAHIRQAEGLMLESYTGKGGLTLIGYGHAGTAQPGMTITELDAEYLLVQDLTEIEAAVASFLEIPVTDDQFGAMVALAYNVGPGAFSRSSILRHVNNGRLQAAADAFLLYDKVKRPDGKILHLAPLTRRREFERGMFLGSAAADHFAQNG